MSPHFTWEKLQVLYWFLVFIFFVCLFLPSLFFFLSYSQTFLKFIHFEREKVCTQAGEGQRKKGGERKSQAGSVLTV